MNPVVVLGGSISALAVVRSLATRDIPVIVAVHDPQEFAHTSKYVREAWRVPNPIVQEEDYIDCLVTGARSLDRAVLIPTSDESLSAVARHKELLENHYAVACDNWEVAHQFIDKVHTYAIAKAVGVPFPRTLVPESLAHLLGNAGDIVFPSVVKPRQAHLYVAAFRKKMVHVETVEELTRAYLEATEVGLQVMVQEFIPGPDDAGANYNAYSYKGEQVVQCTAAKVRLAPEKIGYPRVVESREIIDIIEPARALLGALGVDGFSCTEFKRDERDGIYKLMEVNGRHNMSTLLSIRCGRDFPLMTYQHMVEKTAPEGGAYATGVYWIDEFRDLRGLRRALMHQVSLKDYLIPYRAPHIFAVFDKKDLGPFRHRSARMAQKTVARLVGS